MKKITTTILAAAVAAAMFFAGRECGRNTDGLGGYGSDGGGVVTRVDTVVVREVVRDTVLVPHVRYIVRTDTVWLPTPTDTLPAGDSARVEIPVERKVYLTTDYRAVVEGFRPALVEMELYPRTVQIIDRTTVSPRPRRWGIGIHAGYGIGYKGATPYVGIGLQYNLVTW